MMELNPIYKLDGFLVKKCNKCGNTYELTMFNKSSVKKSKLRGECKKCQQKVRSKYSKKSYRPDKEKDRKLRATYNISLEDFRLMIDEQKSCCAICNKQITGGQTTHVDHCHSTGKIRALLCNSCNQALGLVHENIDTLQRMIYYIEEHSEAK